MRTQTLSLFASLSLAVAGCGLAATPARAEVVSSVAQQVPAVVQVDPYADFTPAEVTHEGAVDVVRFTSKSTGEVHVYRFVRTADATPGVSLYYRWTWTGWELNRKETRELVDEGYKAAIAYALAAEMGMPFASIASLIEGNYSYQAQKALNMGKCLKIYYTTSTSIIPCR